MRRKRQELTRRKNRSGVNRRLKGLTKQEASARTKKAWVKRRQKYDYKTEHRFSSLKRKSFKAEERGDSAEDFMPKGEGGEAELRPRKRGQFDALNPEEISAHGALSKEQFERYMAEQAQTMAMEQDFRDPAFASTILNKLPLEQRHALIDRIRANREFHRRANQRALQTPTPYHSVAVEGAKRKLDDVSDLEYLEEGPGRKPAKEITSSLSKMLNNDPKKSAQLPSEELAKKVKERIKENFTAVDPMDSKVIETGVGLDVTGKAPAGAKRMFIAPEDPVQRKRYMQDLGFIAENIVKSHTGETEAARTAAAHKARKTLSRVAREADSIYKDRRDAGLNLREAEMIMDKGGVAPVARKKFFSQLVDRPVKDKDDEVVNEYLAPHARNTGPVTNLPVHELAARHLEAKTALETYGKGQPDYKKYGLRKPERQSSTLGPPKKFKMEPGESRASYRARMKEELDFLSSEINAVEQAKAERKAKERLQHGELKTWRGGIIDPRLSGVLSTEELYGVYKHEETPQMARAKWEARNALSKLNLAKEPEGTKPRFFQAIRGAKPGHGGQARFIRDQAAHRTDAIRHGNFAAFFDKNKKPVGVGKSRKKTRDLVKQSSFGVIPNKAWQYELNYAPTRIQELTSEGIFAKEQALGEVMPSYKRNVETFDVFTRFAQKPTEGWNEIRSVSQIPRNTERFKVELGKRGIERKQGLPRHVEKEIFIPRSDITKPVTETLRGQSNESFTTYFMRTRGAPGFAGNQEKKITKAEYNVTKKAEPGEPPRPGEAYSKIAKKDVLVTYLPADQAHLLTGEKDSLQVVTPRVRFKGKDVIGSHVVFGNVDADSSGKAAFLARQAIIEPHKAIDRMRKQDIETILSDEFQKSKSQTQEERVKLWSRFQKDEQFKQDVLKEAKTRGYDPEHVEHHINSFLTAGLAAAGYKLIDRTDVATKSRINRGFERGVDKFFGQGTAQHYGVNRIFKETVKAPVEKSFSDATYMLVNPTASRSGKDLANLPGLKSWRYRTFAIPEDLMVARGLEKEARNLASIDRATSKAIKRADRPGVRGWVGRKRLEPMLRYRQAQGYNLSNEANVFNKTIGHTREILNAPTERGARGLEVPKVLRVDPVTGAEHKMTVTSRLQRAAAESQLQAKKLRVADRGKQSQFASIGSPKVFPRASRWSHGELTEGEKWALAGGAIVATAAGAGYLYHRHRENKRIAAGEVYERTSFLNKALPPAFKSPIPTPSWQTTKSYRIPKTELTEFTMSAGSKIPVSGRVHFNRKRVALRPVDRGYPASALVKGPHVGWGAGGQKDGLGKSLFFDFEKNAAYGRGKRSIISKKKSVSVAGQKMPFWLQGGPTSKVKLKGSNPRRITDQDRESIVAAFAGTADERRVREFYSHGKRDKIVDMFDDPELVSEIRHRKGYGEGHIFTSTTSALEIPRGAGLGSTEAPGTFTYKGWEEKKTPKNIYSAEYFDLMIAKDEEELSRGKKRSRI